MPSTISVTAIVSDYMAKYDHNRNGTIELKRPDGLWDKFRNRDERVRTKTSVTPAFGEDTIGISTQVHTIDRLLYASDKDANGVVTREEMEAAVKRYDTDGDGRMGSRGFWGWLTRKPKQEFDVFNGELGERLTHYGSVQV